VERPSLVVVGDVLIDVTVRGGPEHDAEVSLRPGGSASNVAVWAAHLGAQATVVARVGGDLAGRAVQTALEERGVEAQLSEDPEAPTGTFVLINGERWVDRGANASLAPQHLPASIEGDAVVISPYVELETAHAAAQRASSPWVVAVGRPLDDANAVILNEIEAQALEDSRARFRLTCITRGVRGAVATLEGRHASAQPPAVEAGGAAGAGDAFTAGILVSLARGADLDEALVEACRCGAEAAASPTGWPVVK
jgi:sugar/nucleoside kinase (ribokinase family)